MSIRRIWNWWLKMVFKSDAQRKGFFSNNPTNRSNIRPVMTRQATPRLSKEKREFVASKIIKNIKEGKPTKQAIAIGFSQARKKFGNSGLELTKGFKNQRTDFIDKKTRNLLIFLIGVSLALSILRRARTS